MDIDVDVVVLEECKIKLQKLAGCRGTHNQIEAELRTLNQVLNSSCGDVKDAFIERNNQLEDIISLLKELIDVTADTVQIVIDKFGELDTNTAKSYDKK